MQFLTSQGVAQQLASLHHVSHTIHTCSTATWSVDEFRVSHILHRALILSQHDKGSIPAS